MEWLNDSSVHNYALCKTLKSLAQVGYAQFIYSAYKLSWYEMLEVLKLLKIKYQYVLFQAGFYLLSWVLGMPYYKRDATLVRQYQ
jgi:hypothetical protein